MTPFRGEELIRIVAIAASSALVGSISIVIADALNPEVSGGLGGSMLFGFFAFFFMLVACAVLGLFVHLAMRIFYFLPRLLLLPIFVLLGCVSGALLISPSWAYFFVVSCSVSVTAWFLYSFGPFRLWHFEYLEGQHCDF